MAVLKKGAALTILPEVEVMNIYLWDVDNAPLADAAV
jgi:hypothetical protein